MLISTNQGTVMSSKETQHKITLPPGGRLRRQAGPYDQATGSPRYSFQVLAPDDQAKRQVVDNSEVMGAPGRHFYVWDIKNNSTWPVFLTLTVDGVPVAPSQS